MNTKRKPATWTDQLRSLAKAVPEEPEAAPLPEPDGTLPGLIAALDQLNHLAGAKPEATRPEQREYLRHLLVTLMKQLMATIPKETGLPPIQALWSLALALDTVDAEHKPHDLFTPEKPAKPKDGPARRTDTRNRRAFVLAAITYLKQKGSKQGEAVAILAKMVGVKEGTILSDLNNADTFTRDMAKGIVIDSDERLAAAAAQLKDQFNRRDSES